MIGATGRDSWRARCLALRARAAARRLWVSVRCNMCERTIR